MWLSAVPSPSDPLGDDNAVTFPCKKVVLLLLLSLLLTAQFYKWREGAQVCLLDHKRNSVIWKLFRLM